MLSNLKLNLNFTNSLKRLLQFVLCSSQVKSSLYINIRVGMVIFVFDTHHANNILTDSPEHGDHHGTLGMHRACIKHELPTSEGMTFFPY